MLDNRSWHEEGQDRSDLSRWDCRMVIFTSVHKSVQWQCAYMRFGQRQPVSQPRTGLNWWNCCNSSTGELGMQDYWVCILGITRISWTDRKYNKTRVNIMIRWPTEWVGLSQWAKPNAVGSHSSGSCRSWRLRGSFCQHCQHEGRTWWCPVLSNGPAGEAGEMVKLGGVVGK